jgi:hypothetical protein
MNHGATLFIIGAALAFVAGTSLADDYIHWRAAPSGSSLLCDNSQCGGAAFKPPDNMKPGDLLRVTSSGSLEIVDKGHELHEVAPGMTLWCDDRQSDCAWVPCGKSP